MNKSGALLLPRIVILPETKTVILTDKKFPELNEAIVIPVEFFKLQIIFNTLSFQDTREGNFWTSMKNLVLSQE
jgi:hypothetical protein